MAEEIEKMFYSAGRRGFFHSRLHKNALPGDAVEITHERWQELLEGQATGKEIVPDETGLPILSDPTPKE